MYASLLHDVALALDRMYMCGDSGQNMIREDILEHNLNRIVVAACGVGMHEPTFRACVADTGLNSFPMEMANMREQNTWVHSHEPEVAPPKAKETGESWRRYVSKVPASTTCGGSVSSSATA